MFRDIIIISSLEMKSPKFRQAKHIQSLIDH